MRTQKLAVVAVSAALLSAATVSITGQQEALPPVRPKATTPAGGAVAYVPAEPLVYLASYPVEDTRAPMTLVDAARANDYVTFASLYIDAKRRGEPVAEFDTLYTIWTYSITDPVGAFYGRDIYERLASAYPDFAAFIDQYRLTDSRGAVYWPSSETRDFLLARAIEGAAPRVMLADIITLPATPPLTEPWKTAVTVPRVTTQVAEVTPVPARQSSRRSTATSPATGSAVPPRTRLTKNGAHPRPAAASAVAASPAATQRSPITPTVPAQRATSVPAQRTATIPAAATNARRDTAGITPAPAATSRVVQQETRTPAGGEAGAPASDSNRVPQQIAQVAPDAAAARGIAQSERPIAATPAIDAEPAAAPAAQQNPLVNRGILLIIIAIMAAGLLAVMFRTPSEFASVTGDPSARQPKPAKPVAAKPFPADDATAATAGKDASVDPISKQADGRRVRGSRG